MREHPLLRGLDVRGNRQQHAVDAALLGLLRELDRLARVVAAGDRNDGAARSERFLHLGEQRELLRGLQRIAFASRARQHDAVVAALDQEPSDARCFRHVQRVVRVERRHHRSEDASELFHRATTPRPRRNASCNACSAACA